MPKYRFELQSQRRRAIDDRVLVYILETEKSGLIRNGRNLRLDDKSFTSLPLKKTRVRRSTHTPSLV